MSSTRHKEELKKLLQRPENSICADCKGKKSLEWASFNLGVFICTDCVTVHRSLGVHISKVKSVFLDDWTDTAIQIMADNDNKSANKMWEKRVPIFFPRISARNVEMLREHWIKAKYENRLFTGEKSTIPLSTAKRGFLWKKGKIKNEWNRRLFVLSDDATTLSYFINEKDIEPKSEMNVECINATLVGKQKLGKPYGLQLLYKESDGKTRSFYVYSESGKEVIDWLCAIRTAKAAVLGCLYKSIPEQEEERISRMLSIEFLHEGYLEKTGPKENGAFRRRWFSLYDRKLMYFKGPLEPYPLGEIDIGLQDRGYKVQEDDIASHQRGDGFCFVFKTPGRNYYLRADSASEKRKWMRALNEALDSVHFYLNGK